MLRTNTNSPKFNQMPFKLNKKTRVCSPFRVTVVRPAQAAEAEYGDRDGRTILKNLSEAENTTLIPTNSVDEPKLTREKRGEKTKGNQTGLKNSSNQNKTTANGCTYYLKSPRRRLRAFEFDWLFPFRFFQPA